MLCIINALKEALQLLKTDRDIRWVIYNYIDWNWNSLRSSVLIVLLDGHLDTKRYLYRLIIEKLHHFSIPLFHIKIILRESSLESWGIRGGQAACEIDLGFKVNV